MDEFDGTSFNLSEDEKKLLNQVADFVKSPTNDPDLSIAVMLLSLTSSIETQVIILQSFAGSILFNYAMKNKTPLTEQLFKKPVKEIGE